MINVVYFVTILVTAVVALNNLQPRQTCNQDYDLCSPDGVLSLTLPPVGAELRSLYPDLVQAINLKGTKTFFKPQENRFKPKRQSVAPFCCAKTTQCLLLPSYFIPFCWDRFTTDFYFPDGSYGSIVAGNFTSASGAQINLIYGDWKNSDGEAGNIYSSAPTFKPNTSTLPMPTPWTSSGVGSAIPASQLGSSAMMNSTTRTTITAITLLSTTITVGTSICTHCNLTIIPGLTGLPPSTTTSMTTGNTTGISSISRGSSMSTVIVSTFTGGSNVHMPKGPAILLPLVLTVVYAINIIIIIITI